MPEKRKPGRKKSRSTKGRVLQARIPEQLDDQLRNRADRLGLSVSTIVRNVLLNTFDLVEDIVTDSAQVTRAATGRAATGQAAGSGPEEEGAAAAVIGWQEAVLNMNGVCEQCNAILPRGQRAAIGVPAGPSPSLLCLDCLAALATPPDDDSPEDG